MMRADRYVTFSMEHQLLNVDMWADFVRVFRAGSDVEMGAWRYEYWGKMMRGAVLTYMVNKDEALYRVPEGTVLDLLSAQREDGRFSTYPADNQLFGWDMWGRKCVLSVAADFTLRTLFLEGRTAFFYGPLTVARDEAREEGECVHLRVERADGKEPLLLTDYASCGKRWLDVKNRLTVWLYTIP